MVTNNYPIDAIKLGADIIIGVDVQDDLRTELPLGCHFSQITNLHSIEEMKKKVPKRIFILSLTLQNME
jgi:NTE family protein